MRFVYSLSPLTVFLATCSRRCQGLSSSALLVAAYRLPLAWAALTPRRGAAAGQTPFGQGVLRLLERRSHEATLGMNRGLSELAQQLRLHARQGLGSARPQAATTASATAWARALHGLAKVTFSAPALASLSWAANVRLADAGFFFPKVNLVGPILVRGLRTRTRTLPLAQVWPTPAQSAVAAWQTAVVGLQQRLVRPARAQAWGASTLGAFSRPAAFAPSQGLRAPQGPTIPEPHLIDALQDDLFGDDLGLPFADMNVANWASPVYARMPRRRGHLPGHPRLAAQRAAVTVPSGALTLGRSQLKGWVARYARPAAFEHPASVSVVRVRLAPGWPTQWRESRKAYVAAFNLPFFRQRRLTQYLAQMRRVTGFALLKALELSVGYVAACSGLSGFLALRVGWQQVLQGCWALNGRPVKNPFLQVYRGDWLQFFGLTCGALSPVFTHLQPATQWRRSHLSWLNSDRAVASPAYLEVDELARTVCLLAEPARLADFSRAVLQSGAYLSHRMYNWKYVT